MSKILFPSVKDVIGTPIFMILSPMLRWGLSSCRVETSDVTIFTISISLSIATASYIKLIIVVGQQRGRTLTSIFRFLLIACMLFVSLRYVFRRYGKTIKNACSAI